MGKKVPELVTYWGPSVADWGFEKRFVVERDEDLLRQGAGAAKRPLQKISLDEIFTPGVVTGLDMSNGYMPLILYANEDIIIEVANCSAEQGGWHRNMGGDEWVFQYRGSRTIDSEFGPVTINEGEMSVIPRGISHKNIGHGPNIEITIYTRNPLRRLAPADAEEARSRMKMQDGKPARPPLQLDDGE